MKLTLEEIEQAINYMAEALTYAKEARRVYGSDTETSQQLKYAYEYLRRANTVLEERYERSPR